jgi:hypothetical protein
MIISNFQLSVGDEHRASQKAFLHRRAACNRPAAISCDVQRSDVIGVANGNRMVRAIS